MHKKKEICRNFQRGSCQYGARCKFLHPTPQPQLQQQQQQPKSNPFGFGVQSNNKQFKPFENKWTRFSPISNAAAVPAAASATPSPSLLPDNHNCTDPDSCKNLIAQDFNHERPIWKLTCYGHVKNGPCDIIGDTSYEELRAMAYDDAKHGLSLQTIERRISSRANHTMFMKNTNDGKEAVMILYVDDMLLIESDGGGIRGLKKHLTPFVIKDLATCISQVERERGLLSSKLTDFENLLRKRSGLGGRSPFPGANHDAASSIGQNSAPPSVSTFGQLGASLYMGLGTRPSAPSNNGFGQLNLVPNSSPTSSAFGVRPSSSNNILGQSNLFSNPGQNSSTYQMNFPSINAGSFGSQLPNTGFHDSSLSSALLTQNSHSSSGLSPMISNGPNSASSATELANANVQSLNDVKRENVAGAAGIWLKEKWIPGEIPEEAPPDEFVF